MIKIHELPGDSGRKQSKKRIGRGHGSGQGKTAGKGHKGQQARSGGSKGKGFEGGQMPLIRRIPKFGFTNRRFRKNKSEITLGQLERFDAGTVVDFSVLLEQRLVAKTTEYYKVIATGELTRNLTVKANGFSASAREAIEKAGGSCEII